MGAFDDLIPEADAGVVVAGNPFADLLPEAKPVIRDVAPGRLAPQNLLPAVRNASPFGFMDRETAATALLAPRAFEPGGLPTSDLSALQEPEGYLKQLQRIAEAEMPQPLLTLPTAPAPGIAPTLVEKLIPGPLLMPPAALTEAVLGKTAGEVQVQVQRELYNAAKSLPEFFTTEEGMLAGLASLTPLGQAGVTAYFTFDMAKDVLNEAKSTVRDWDNLSPTEKAARITQSVAKLGFVGLLAKAGIGQVKARLEAPSELLAPSPELLRLDRRLAEIARANAASQNQLPNAVAEALKGVVQDATKERVITEGRVAEYPGAEAERLPAKAGRGDRLEPGEKVEPAKVPEERPQGVLLDPEKTGPLKSAAFINPVTGDIETGAYHLEAVEKVGGPQLAAEYSSRESRNGPEFGYLTANGIYVPRSEAGPIAKHWKQDLVEFEKTPSGKELPHTDEVAAKPGGAVPMAEEAQLKTIPLPAEKPKLVERPATPENLVREHIDWKKAYPWEPAAQDPVALADQVKSHDSGRVKGQNVSNTRRIFVLQGSDGRVHVVSGYVASREGVETLRILNPDAPHPKKPNTDAAVVLRTFKPLYTGVLKEPVANFKRTYSSVAEFESLFGRPVEQALRAKRWTETRAIAPEPVTTTVEPKLPAEPAAIIRHMQAYPDFESAKRGLLKSPDKNEIYDFLNDEVDKLQQQQPKLTDEQAYLQILTRFFDQAKTAPTKARLGTPADRPRGAPTPAGPTPTTPPSTAAGGLMRPGPGAATPAEIAQRTERANRLAKTGQLPPPPPNPPVTIEAGEVPTPEVVRQNADYHILNRVNSPQWLFYFGRLGQAAKSAFETLALGEYNMRESIARDVRTYVHNTIRALPGYMRKSGGQVFFEVLDGKTMDQIRAEWETKPNGELIIAQAEKVKTRLEEIRTTIRDLKRDSFNRYLQGLDRPSLEDLFRKNISETTNTSKMTKEDLANALSLDQFPDDWGIADGSYLPHLFFGQWRVRMKMPGEESASFVTRAQTIQEAKARVYQQVKANPELKDAQFTIEQDTVVPADMIRLGDRRFWVLVQQMRDQNAMTSAEVKAALRGNIGRKAAKQKWFGSIQQRLGFRGYSEDYIRSMTAYLNGFHRWNVLTRVNREVQPLIEQVRREGRTNAADRLEELLANLWGKPQRTTQQFDAWIRRIPGLRDYIKPLALDRWSRTGTNLTGLLTLRTLRFSVVNRLQPLQTLYPLIGERGIIEAKLLQHSASGKKLLQEAGVDLDPGQYAGEFGRLTRGKQLLERFSGERSNQEVAFLAMYQHARAQGISHAEAIRYGKLRGQLMTQFTPLLVDTPELFEGPFGRLIFQYKRFPVKSVELTARMAADRNVPAIARQMAVFATLGGLAFWLRQTWFTDPDSRLRLKRGLDKELGTKGGDAVMYGLPGLMGADISGSITLGDEPMGRNLYEKGARALTGPALSLILETARTLATEKRRQTTTLQDTETLLRRFPATRPLAELSAMLRADIDVRTPDGEIKLRRKMTDAIAGLGSFRSANEANIALVVNGMIGLAKEEARLKNDYVIGKDKAAALEAIRAFNRMWPEAAISPSDLHRYAAYRRTAAKQTDVTRLAGKRYERLLPPEQRVRR